MTAQEIQQVAKSGWVELSRCTSMIKIVSRENPRLRHSPRPTGFAQLIGDGGGGSRDNT